MADFGAPATANYTAPDGLATLSSLMSLKQKQQTLQSGALGIQAQEQGLQGQAADVAMRQRDNQQQGAAAQFFKSFDLSQHVKEDGTLDLDSAMTSPDFKATGSAAPEIIQHLVGIKNSQLAAKQNLASLNGELRGQFQQTVGGLSADADVKAGNNTGKGKVQDAIQQFSDSGGPDAARISQIYGPVIQNTPPNKLSSVLNNIHLQAVSAGQQAETTKPSGPMVTDPSGNLKVVNTNAYAGGPVGAQVGQTAGQGIAPQITGLPTGQVGVVAPGGRSVAPIPSAGGPGANANPTAPQMDAARGQAQAITGRVAQAQEQANSTIQTQDALTRALNIVEKGGASNPGALFQTKTSIKNFLAGVGYDTPGADDNNSLVKNLARYESSRATSAGLGHTDAARDLAHTGSPNIKVDDAALHGIVRQSLATEKAIAAYGNVTSKTTDPQALAAKEKQFRSIPNLIEGYEYGLTKSPQDANEFLQKHNISKDEMKKTRAQIKEFESQ
jgi:hypothetical protein